LRRQPPLAFRHGASRATHSATERAPPRPRPRPDTKPSSAAGTASHDALSRHNSPLSIESAEPRPYIRHNSPLIAKNPEPRPYSRRTSPLSVESAELRPDSGPDATTPERGPRAGVDSGVRRDLRFRYGRPLRREGPARDEPAPTRLRCPNRAGAGAREEALSRPPPIAHGAPEAGGLPLGPRFFAECVDREATHRNARDNCPRSTRFPRCSIDPSGVPP